MILSSSWTTWPSIPSLLPELLPGQQEEKTQLDVFYYDADHTREATCEGICWAAPVFADEVVLLIDDWSSQPIREGVADALQRIPFHMVCRFITTWWNGFFVCLLQKTGE